MLHSLRFRYLVVGLTTKLFGSVLFACAYRLTNDQIVLSNFIVLVVTPSLNLLLHRKFTYRVRTPRSGFIFRYIQLLIIGFIFDTALLTFLIRNFENVFVDKLLSSILVAIFLYIANNRYVFVNSSDGR